MILRGSSTGKNTEFLGTLGTLFFSEPEEKQRFLGTQKTCYFEGGGLQLKMTPCSCLSTTPRWRADQKWTFLMNINARQRDFLI